MEANPTIIRKASQVSLSASKQALLEKRLRGALKGVGKSPSITPRAEAGPAPLSFTQQQLWFIDQLQPGSAAYILGSAFRLEGPMNVPALEKGLSEIVARHEILRTVFPAKEGVPMQVVA